MNRYVATIPASLAGSVIAHIAAWPLTHLLPGVEPSSFAGLWQAQTYGTIFLGLAWFGTMVALLLLAGIDEAFATSMTRGRRLLIEPPAIAGICFLFLIGAGSYSADAPPGMFGWSLISACYPGISAIIWALIIPSPSRSALPNDRGV